LEKPRRRWNQNGSYGDGLGYVDWIHLAQDRGWWRAFCKYGDEPVGSGTTELIN
jgi:hypothetical protein